MSRIATKFGMTTGEILRLNHMNLKDTLYVDRLFRVAVVDVEKQEANTERRIVSRSGIIHRATRPHLYRVRKGDTLTSIAQANGTNLGTLLKINNRKLKDHLYVGSVIRLFENQKRLKEAPKEHAVASRREKSVSSKKTHETYRVKKGDTLHAIAKRHGTTTSVLLSMNGLKRTDHLYVDKELKMPTGPTL